MKMSIILTAKYALKTVFLAKKIRSLVKILVTNAQIHSKSQMTAAVFSMDPYARKCLITIGDILHP